MRLFKPNHDGVRSVRAFVDTVDKMIKMIKNSNTATQEPYYKKINSKTKGNSQLNANLLI